MRWNSGAALPMTVVPGVSAAENLARNAGRQYVGYLPALESAWRVGNTVVQEITTHWNKYK